MAAPRVTVAVPSFGHGRFVEQALESLAAQDVPLEIFVADAGSTDGTVEILRRWEGRLAGWRSHPDAGQAAAINEGVAKGTAPFVCWLNSDDWLLPGALSRLLAALEADPSAPMAYGRAWNVKDDGSRRPVLVRPFSEFLMARFCVVSQPATLIRRAAWEKVGGLDESLHMAMDYDLWWRLHRAFGPPAFVDEFLAANRDHAGTKTRRFRSAHYREAIAVVRRHYGRVPLKWYLAQPWAVWMRSWLGR